jgi:Ca2+-binding EF-hand superfamily protein
MITAKELSDAIHKMKMNMSDREINDLIEQVDY